MTIDGREIAAIKVIEEKTGIMLAAVTDKTLLCEDGYRVKLVTKYGYIPTEDLISELANREGVTVDKLKPGQAMVCDGQETVIRIKK